MRYDSLYVLVLMLCAKHLHPSSLRGELDLVPEQEIVVRKWSYSGWCPGALPSVSRITLTAQEVRLFNSGGFMKILNLLQGHVAKGLLLLGGAPLTYEQTLLALQHLYPNRFMTLYVRPTTLSEPETELTACVECRVMMHSTVSDVFSQCFILA